MEKVKVKSSFLMSVFFISSSSLVVLKRVPPLRR